MGWLADRRSRRNLVLGAILVWSSMAVLCGLAASYGELFAARVGVGIGEAALGPAALSLIADYFPPERRGRAIAIYYIGALVGTGMATTLGALILRLLEAGARLPLLEHLAPWQSMFCLSGAPGFVVAALLFSVREPRRQDRLKAARSQERNPANVVSFLAARWRTFLPVYASLTILQFCGFAVTAWVIPLLVRRLGMSTPAAGTTYGTLMIVVGVLSALVGGWTGDRLSIGRRRGGRFQAVAFTFVALVPGVVILGTADTPLMAVIGLILELLAVCMAASIMYAVLQDIVPNQYRGQAIALLSMSATLIGATCGPTAVALVTDHIFADPGRVGSSLLVVCVPLAVAGLLITLGGLRAYDQAGQALREAAAAAAE
jgi:MFS family permease